MNIPPSSTIYDGLVAQLVQMNLLFLHPTFMEVDNGPPNSDCVPLPQLLESVAVGWNMPGMSKTFHSLGSVSCWYPNTTLFGGNDRISAPLGSDKEQGCFRVAGWLVSVDPH